MLTCKSANIARTWDHRRLSRHLADALLSGHPGITSKFSLNVSHGRISAVVFDQDDAPAEFELMARSRARSAAGPHTGARHDEVFAHRVGGPVSRPPQAAAEASMGRFGVEG